MTCTTVAALETDAFREERFREGDCSQIAAWIEDNPDRLAKLLPQVTGIHVRFQTDDFAVVDVRLALPGHESAQMSRLFVLAESRRGWKLGTRSEAGLVEPVRVGPDVDVDSDVRVFLERGLSEEQTASVEFNLAQRSEIVALQYVGEEESLMEASQLFEGNDSML